MVKSLIAGVALAAAVVATQPAEAGHGRVWYRPHCAQPVYRGYNWQHGPVQNRYYVPTAPSTVQGAPAATPAGPPVASGQGQTIRRFSEEPGVEAAPQGTVTPQTVTPAPSYQPSYQPSVRPQPPSASPPRNPVERRLRPGGGWRR